jgi:hypothetical protein
LGVVRRDTAMAIFYTSESGAEQRPDYRHA